MASIVPPRARTRRSFRRLGMIAAGVATSLVLMGASLAALTGNVLSVTHWSDSHDEATKGQLLPEIPSRPALGGGTAAGGQSPTGSDDQQTASTPPSAATAAPTPLPSTGGASVVASPRLSTGADDGRVPASTGPTATPEAWASSKDSDGDGLTNGQEIRLGTDAGRADSDGDGLPDGWEVKFGLDPRNAGDAHRDGDRDGVDNRNEFLIRSNPARRDSNRDGIEDGDDDPDGDGIPSDLQHPLGLDPAAPVTSNGTGRIDIPLPAADVVVAKPTTVMALHVPDDGSRDSDGDGLPNALEVKMGLDPASATTQGTDDAAGDYDGDGLANALEIKLGLDPTKADTDNDGITDSADDSDG